MQARYYDPVIGRFYSNDPVGYTAKNPVMSFNRYMYVNNNPYKYKDPNGEFLAGAFFSAALDVGIQLIENGGDITKVDPTQTAIAFVTGAVGAGIGEKIAKAGSLVAKATNSKVAGATVDITGNTVAAGSIEGVKEGVLATADALSGSDLAAGDATSDVLTGTRDGLVGSTANQVVSNATGNSKLGQLAEFGASAD